MHNSNPIGTTHHDLCPQCGNYTVDKQTGVCYYMYCKESLIVDMNDEVIAVQTQIGPIITHPTTSIY